MNAKGKDSLSIAVFDDGNFPVLSSAFQCTVQSSMEKLEEYCRKMSVDVAVIGKTAANPSVNSNIASITKFTSSAQVIAITEDLSDAQSAFAHGAADCILRKELTAERIEQRTQFVQARARYLRHGGDWQLYTPHDLAAIARVLSHDIRNALSGIVLSLEPIKQACGNNPEAKSYLEILDRSATKLNQVVNRFSSATGNIALRPKEENLMEIIRNAVVTLPEKDGSAVKITENYTDEVVLYSVDREKLPIAITNLVNNALDSMDGKPGELKITTEVTGNEAVLTIQDSGHGVDFTTLQNMFRPFFTTRPGKAGLGLPLAQSIIHAHGGNLRVESNNGAGTTVVCRFPLSR